MLRFTCVCVPFFCWPLFRDYGIILNPNQPRIQFAFFHWLEFDLFLVFLLLLLFPRRNRARKREMERELHLHFFVLFIFPLVRLLCAHQVWPPHRHTFSKWKWISLTMKPTVSASGQPTNIYLSTNIFVLSVYSNAERTQMNLAENRTTVNSVENFQRPTRSNVVEFIIMKNVAVTSTCGVNEWEWCRWCSMFIHVRLFAKRNSNTYSGLILSFQVNNCT